MKLLLISFMLGISDYITYKKDNNVIKRNVVAPAVMGIGKRGFITHDRLPGMRHENPFLPVLREGKLQI